MRKRRQRTRLEQPVMPLERAYMDGQALMARHAQGLCVVAECWEPVLSDADSGFQKLMCSKHELEGMLWTKDRAGDSVHIFQGSDPTGGDTVSVFVLTDTVVWSPVKVAACFRGLAKLIDTGDKPDDGDDDDDEAEDPPATH